MIGFERKLYSFVYSCASSIDAGISAAVKGSIRLSMTKSVFDGKTETTITSEKSPIEVKQNRTYVWPKFGFFNEQNCDFCLEKGNFPELTMLYLNQAYLIYKDGKKIFYADLFIIETREDFDNHMLQPNEAELIRPKYVVVSGQFFSLVETLGYLTVRGDVHESFFDYGYSKKNSKVSLSTQKMKIPNSFSGTMFGQYKMKYEAWAILDSDFSWIYFSLPATTDRIEEVNQYMNPVSLNPIDIEPAEFGDHFDPSFLDFANKNKEKSRESVLKVLKKMVDISNANLKHNADGLLAK